MRQLEGFASILNFMFSRTVQSSSFFLQSTAIVDSSSLLLLHAMSFTFPAFFKEIVFPLFRMKRFLGGGFLAFLFTLLVLRFSVKQSHVDESHFTASIANSTDPLSLLNATIKHMAQNHTNSSRVISADATVSSLFSWRNLSEENQQSLQAWKRLKNLANYTHDLPNSLQALKEAGLAWKSLIDSIQKRKLSYCSNGSLQGRRAKEKQCPHFLNKINNSDNLRFPCGLTQDSAVTIIGNPNGSDFRIDLIGEPLPGEPDPPIILHYNVRLHGDGITQEPVIVQNTWTVTHDWGAEDRCPSTDPEKNKKVDELDQCDKMVGRNSDRSKSDLKEKRKSRNIFPFHLDNHFVSTLRVGVDGIHMTVDGKHITSFSYRENLEPWLVSEVRISGDLKLISVLASGLPTSEDSDHITNIQSLKAVPFSLQTPLELFIGVFSTANNFKHRMAARRTWMQSGAVKSGVVAVKFFVGMHKNRIVNEEIWEEANTYGDIQLMPFVDYYNLITWKTIAICIFGAEASSAKFIMKTDDDSFIRVDEILASLQRINRTSGLLYGLIDSDSRPQRNLDSKWYISPEEWSEEIYPIWAHGPGYVVSRDIAIRISKQQEKGRLKMFKLEDVAMGIWIEEMKKEGLEVWYEDERRIRIEGCKNGYVVAHYQGPKQMLCLWQKLQDGTGPNCCNGG